MSHTAEPHIAPGVAQPWPRLFPSFGRPWGIFAALLIALFAAYGARDTLLPAMLVHTPLPALARHSVAWGAFDIIVDWGTGQAETSYPGGQDENPASPWYENKISRWWNGQYYSMIDAEAAREQPGSVIWTLSK